MRHVCQPGSQYGQLRRHAAAFRFLRHAFAITLSPPPPPADAASFFATFRCRQADMPYAVATLMIATAA